MRLDCARDCKMRTSEQINEIATSMAKTHVDLKNPAAAKANAGFRGAKYAPLHDVLDVVRPAYAKNGIAIIQATSVTGDGVILTTRLVDKSGQWVESDYPVCKFDSQQKMAAAMTMAKRQAMYAMCAVFGDDDMDANDSADVNTDVGGQETVKTVLSTLNAFATNAAQVDEWWRKNKDAVSKLNKTQMDEVIAACAKKKNELQNEAAE